MITFREHLNDLYYERENADAAWDAFHHDEDAHYVRFNLSYRRPNGRYKRLGEFELPVEHAKLAMERVMLNLTDSIKTLHDVVTD